ncbi:membrane cofactor protein-like [Anolis sagrei]|uniref:membrane cofactor protein-like n=1 Tax=Anolis sagrei TaxID=38937 RepID=UPI003522DF02
MPQLLVLMASFNFRSIRELWRGLVHEEPETTERMNNKYAPVIMREGAEEAEGPGTRAGGRPGERKEGSKEGGAASDVTGARHTHSEAETPAEESLLARALSRKSSMGGAFLAVGFAGPARLPLSRSRTKVEEEEKKGGAEGMEGPAWSLLLLLLLPLLLLSGAHGDCSAPPAQLHATLMTEVDSYPVGTTVRYRCIPGYQYISGANPTIKCLESSEWSTTPTFCEERSCRAPTVENGGIRGDLQLGATITYFCDPGYKPIGATTAHCIVFESSVQWDTDPPLCDRIQCVRPPVINNGRHNLDGHDVYTVGIVITYFCDGSLSLIGNSSITCVVEKDTEKGIWDNPAPECKAVECSRPQIENGRLTSAFQPTYKYNQRLQFVCNDGYTLRGPEFVTCNSDSEWSELPKCHIEPEKPTIRPGPGTTTTETITETITKETGSTQRPDPGDKPGEDKPGSNTIVGIVIGVLAAIIVVVAGFVLYSKKLLCFKKGQSDTPPNPSKPYHAVSRKEVEMEEK